METPKEKLTVAQFMKLVGVSKTTAYRMLDAEESGVYRIQRKGSTRVMYRVDPEVAERILRRSAA
jgi:predicted DNA-binding transcriptional regulator YafY